MRKLEWKLCRIFVVALGIFIIETVAVFTEDCDVYADSVIASEEIIAETAGSPENGQIRDSGMPCEVPERFAEWYEQNRRKYEPETSEETRSDDIGTDHEEAGTNEDPQTEPVTEMENAMPTLYKIAGQEIDASLQIKLYQHLQAAGIPWWYEGALCQMFQESHCQQYAVNQHNGLDMGLFQYRSTFWDWSSDIFDVDAQMSKYASEMSTRFNMGLSMDEAISRHNTSDHVTAVNWEYVGQVKQWLSQMEVVQ